MLFGDVAVADGHNVIHYGFDGMKAKVKKLHMLTPVKLETADPFVGEAAILLNRGLPRENYVKNLIRRNYFQVKDAERVYAITRWNLKKGSTTGETMEGQLGRGTGWTVAMAMILKIPEIYLFVMEKDCWYIYNHKISQWQTSASPPKPHGRYTGIGSRNSTRKEPMLSHHYSCK